MYKIQYIEYLSSLINSLSNQVLRQRVARTSSVKTNLNILHFFFLY